jgi:hypothetical protein
MINDAHWQRDLIAALHWEAGSDSGHLGFPGAEYSDALQPSRAESEQAVANIRAWRSYLPKDCVAKMIEDGWQWST